MTSIWTNPTLGISRDKIRDTLQVCRSASVFCLSLAQLSCPIHHMFLWERNLQVGVIFMHTAWVHSTAIKAH